MPQKRKIELLSPAGNNDSLKAALAAGADAVYFGSTSFSNRARAKNFDDPALLDAIKMTHSCGAKAYITVNTRVRDAEMEDVLRLISLVLEAKEPADALIMADFGAAHLTKQRYPDAILHASTQTTLSSYSDFVEIAQLGFSRAVLPRELRYDEIARICKTSPIGTEIFIHGAHCVSLSGQCLMSFVMGGRSGNRGECAQPCRLPYSVNSSPEGVGGASSYPLSLADMCLAGNMEKILSSGVSSLKIEGRLRPASYVYGVTGIYRRLLDEGRSAEPAEIRELESYFTRTTTDGYFTGRYFLMSAKNIKKPENKQNEPDYSAIIRRKQHEAAGQKSGKIPIKAELRLHSDEPVSLTFSCGEIGATVCGNIPTQADGKALDKALSHRQLSKLGDTKFTLNESDLTLVTDGNYWLGAAELNALRRECANQLNSKLMESARCEEMVRNGKSALTGIDNYSSVIRSKLPITGKHPARAAIFYSPDTLLQLSGELLSGFEKIYIPAGEFVQYASRIHGKTGYKSLCAVLPPLSPSDEQTTEIIKSCLSTGLCAGFLLNTPGQPNLVRQVCETNGYDPARLLLDFSYRCNITNSAALSLYESYLPTDVFLSPELPAKAAAKLHASTFCYGKLPVMALARCVICQINGNKCPKGRLGGRIVEANEQQKINNCENNPRHCRAYLVDRRGEAFPVIGGSDCVNYVFNSVPIWMADRMSSFDGCRTVLFCFTDENADEIESVVKDYANGIHRDGRRI